MESNCAGLILHRQKPPLTRRSLVYYCSGVHRLGSYELFRRPGPLEPAVWERMIRGLSTRNYAAVVKEFAEAYGVEKSATREHFIQAGQHDENRAERYQACSFSLSKDRIAAGTSPAAL